MPQDALRRFTQGGSPVGVITWVVPGGIYADDKTRQIPRITGTNVTVEVTFEPKGGAVMR